MDWDRIENLLSRLTQKLVFIDSISFLLDFFETLLKALKDCASVDQCSSLYPRAGPLLTTFATHPYIGCNEKLVSLVIDCIIEYTKYSFDSKMAVSQFIPRSSIWCLQRLRRLSYSPTTNQVLLLPRTMEQKIDKVASSIQEQSKNGNLTITKMDQLCDMALLLLKDDTALKVVEALMDAALELEQRQRNERKKYDIVRWNANDTTGTCALSDRFTKYVLDNMNNENGFYQQQWPVTLKTKAWQTIPDLFECEWMDLMERQLDSEKDGNAISKGRRGQIWTGTMVRHPLLEGLNDCPCLMYVSFTLMSRWICDSDLADWRIIGLWIKLVDWYLVQYESFDDTHEKIQQWGFPGNLIHSLELMLDASPLSLSHCDVDQIYSGLVSYIYGGSPLTLTLRRNEAWLLSLMCPFYNFWCVGLWIGWCTEDKSIWSDKMDKLTKYIAWLVCPSLDKRMDSYYYGLKKWIQSLKGFNRRDPSANGTDNRFIDDWYILFNGQIQMGVDVLVTMIQCSQNWTTDQCIAMIDRFLDRTNTRGVSTKARRGDNDSVTVPLVERLTALDDSRMNSLISYVYSILP